MNAQTCSTSSTVRFQTTLGGIDVVLTPSVTPLTVANFMTYVCSGAYTSGYFDVDRTKPYTGGTIIHRSLNASNQTPPFYLIQGGGFALGAGNLPALIPQNAPVTNEFKTSNTRGTLAMAQYGSDINSATNEWYFNTIDNNSGLSNLDSQSFTVFGNVANDASLAVMDAINALPTYSYNAGQSANFANLPLQNYASGLIKPSNYIFVNSIAPISPANSSAGVVSAATGVPNSSTGGIAPGEILALYGQDLGPTQFTTATLSSAGLVNTSLEGTQVLFNGVAGPMWYTSTGQIAVIVPYEIDGQSTVSVVVSYLGLQTSPITFKVVPANPGVFTQNYGKGDAIVVRISDKSVISTSNPALPGDTLILYGEGYGVTSPLLADGAFYTGGAAPVPVAKTVLLIDGQAVNTSYAGAAGGDVNGVLQINFVVPQLKPGPHTIQVQVGNAVSPTGVNLQTK